MEMHRFTMSNGVRAVVVPTEVLAPVSFQAWFSSGARAEKETEWGLAHFNEHMFYKGGRDFPDSRSLEREFRLLGDMQNAGTSKEAVFFHILVGRQHVRKAMHIFSDMLVHASMRQEDLEQERGVILQELKDSNDDPRSAAETAFDVFLFGNHPLGRDTLGSETTINRFTADDVWRFKERFYGPPNMVVALAGGVNLGQSQELMEEYFGSIRPKEKTVWAPFLLPGNHAPVRLIESPELEQARLVVGSFAPSYFSPDISPMNVLTEVLTYRLWREIREQKGLAYTVSATHSDCADIGQFKIYAGLDHGDRQVQEVLKLIFREMAAIKSGGVSEEEASEAKVKLQSNHELSLESVSMTALFVASFELFLGRARTSQEALASIERVTKNDIVRLAADLWREESVYSLLLSTNIPRFEEKYCALRKVLR